MYSLLRERIDFKNCTLQSLLLGSSVLLTEAFVRILVEERRIFPESFALESILFLAIWFGLDFFTCSILGSKSILQSFTNQAIAGRCLTTLAISWTLAIVFFRVYSFAFELLMMLGLWLLLDYFSNKAGRKVPWQSKIRDKS
jgi:hypothetical protein